MYQCNINKNGKEEKIIISTNDGVNFNVSCDSQRMYNFEDLRCHIGISRDEFEYIKEYMEAMNTMIDKFALVKYLYNIPFDVIFVIRKILIKLLMSDYKYVNN